MAAQFDELPEEEAGEAAIEDDMDEDALTKMYIEKMQQEALQRQMEEKRRADLIEERRKIELKKMRAKQAAEAAFAKLQSSATVTPSAPLSKPTQDNIPTTQESFRDMFINLLADPEVKEQVKGFVQTTSSAERPAELDPKLAAELYPDLHIGAEMDEADKRYVALFKPYLFSAASLAQKNIREADILLQQLEDVENTINIGRNLSQCKLAIVPGTSKTELFTALLPHTKGLLEEFPPGFKATQLRSQTSGFISKMGSVFAMVSNIISLLEFKHYALRLCV